MKKNFVSFIGYKLLTFCIKEKMFTPLEQFEIFLILPFEFYFYNYFLSFEFLHLNTIFVYLLVVFFLIFTSFYMIFLYNSEFVPVRLQLIFELAFSFILGLVKQQSGKSGLKYFPFFMFLFFFILFSNLVGLVPYSFTLTSQVVITFFLAFSLNLSFVVIGCYLHGQNFKELFIPKGSPKWLTPLITLIEIFSYLIRTFSLSIRLFTNMTAGHTLLHMIISFSLLFLKSYLFGFFLFSFVLSFLVFILEFGIAFLQSYVFVIFSII